MASREDSRAAQRRQRTVYLPESLDKKVRVRAAQLDTTVSQVVMTALQAFFAAERELSKRPKTNGRRLRS